MTDIQEKPKSKRILVPDFYKVCCKVMEAYLNCKGKIPQLVNVMTNKNPRRSRGACQFLLLLAPNLSIIKIVIENVGLFQKFKLSPLMAYIIVGDLLLKEPMSERFKNLSYPVISVLSMKEELIEEFAKQGGLAKCKEQSFGTSPRWVFVNSLHATVDEVKDTLLENGYYLVDLPEKTYDCFLETVKTLGPNQYLDDFHLPGLLALPPTANIKNSHLFAEQRILLQDKASCLPPLVSGVIPGMNVVDACAAPGNKTILLANLLKGKGRLTAIDKDEERFSLMKLRLSDHGVKNVRCIKSNFTDVPHSDLQGVQVVLVDPSCSNSGVSMHTDERSQSAERVLNLAFMQVKLLSHALSIPGVQTVVYSTCSVHYEENEGVVEEAMFKFNRHFDLEDLGQHVTQWKHFGLEKSPYCGKVLRTKPKVDLCHGFFVAKFVAKAEVKESVDWTEVNEFQEEYKENDQRESHGYCVGSDLRSDVLDDSTGYSKVVKKPKWDSLLDNASEILPENIICNLNSKSDEFNSKQKINVAKDDSTTSQLDENDNNENTEFGKTKRKHRKTLPDNLEDVKTANNTIDYFENNSSEDLIVVESSMITKAKKNKRKHASEDDCTVVFETNKCKNSFASKDFSENDSRKEKKREKDAYAVSSAVDCDRNENCDTKKEKKMRKTHLIGNSFHAIGNDFVECEVIENEKEKKKRRKMLENSLDASEIDIVEGEIKETKKEKKRKMLENSLDSSEIDIVECEIKETKKEKKRKILENSLDSSEINIVEGEMIETKKEKKRKILENSLDSSEIDIVEDEIKETKKEKKRKRLENSLDSSGIDIVEGEVKETKKEKKRKMLENSLNSSGIDIVEGEIKETKKEKRKRRNMQENSFDANEVDFVDKESSETRKKKKKRSEDLHENTSLVNEVHIANGEINGTKKEKKKRMKDFHGTSEANGVAAIEVGEVNETKKEKRKRKKDLQKNSFVVHEVEIADNEISVTKKEKRRKDLRNAFSAIGLDNFEAKVSETKKDKKKRKDSQECASVDGIGIIDGEISSTKRKRKYNIHE